MLSFGYNINYAFNFLLKMSKNATPIDSKNEREDFFSRMIINTRSF